jgi:hypothetical protein
MVYHEYPAPEKACTGRLCWIWGVYAIAMAWLWNGLTAAGIPALAIWAMAGFAGAMLLLATREI